MATTPTLPLGLGDDDSDDNIFDASITDIEETMDNEDEAKKLAKQLLEVLQHDEGNVNTGLMQHLRAFIAGMILSSTKERKGKNKTQRTNPRKLRAETLKSLCVVFVIVLCFI